ncbi:MAG: hypothetical protein KBT46_04000 [Ruminococcus sp.]|nr:hypothetical protein [Candidatus Copronaster equi]
MANRNDILALDLDLFDNTKNGYVPARKSGKKVQQPRLVKPKPVSRKQVEAEVRASRIAAVKACAIALVTLIILGSLIYNRVVLTNCQSELEKQTQILETAQSENVRLNMKFNSIMSMEKIEEYAQSKLGMVKKDTYQVKYFDISQDSGVSQTKQVDN